MLGGGVNKSPRKNLKSFIALGLSSILPSLAFSSESNEALNQLLTTAPQAPSDSKTQKMENYSPIADLRSNTRATQYDQTFDNGFDTRANLIFNQNTNVFIGDLTTDEYGDIALKFTANNNALVTMDFDLDRCVDSAGIFNACGGFEGNGGFIAFKGDGHFVINANMHSIQNVNDPSGFIEMVVSSADYGQEDLEVYSALTFKASGNVGSFLRATQAYDVGNFIFNTPYLEIDMDNNGANKNTQKYFIYTQDHYTLPGLSGYAKIYLNADVNNPQNVYNQSSVLKITGSIRSTKNTRLYANFTNSDSFLKGNLELGSGSAQVTFSNGSSMIGNIDYVNDNVGNHSIIFDNANYAGQIKDAQSGKSTNTSVVFKNTAGRTFGNGTEDIVDSSYKGVITGTFDMSTNSTTIINGGANGDKGFAGGGTNTLVFDFKSKANTASSQAFAIAGGDSNSIYVLSRFQQSATAPFDYTTVGSSNTLYDIIKKAGINIAVDTQGDDSKNHLNGTLFFQRTNIKTGSGDNALFANASNIVGTGKSLNDLALGAMFGNATWNDANKDGAITANEITANANGTNYKLSKDGVSVGNNVTDNTSTGDIGSLTADGASDDVKKQVAFIFTDGTYDFEGDTQGYSGTIKGGTNDSKYYFANAGYITRTQINDAKGDLVLFNTAFRGDLGVENSDVSIILDFSKGRNGLRSESGDGFSNIVGSGSKNIVFNFTKNEKKDKFGGAVVGTATSDAKYTMLNLKKYDSDNNISANNGALSLAHSGTLVDAIVGAGLTNFNNPKGNKLGDQYGANKPDTTTNIGNFDTSKTTLALRGTSLNTANIDFTNYIYDLAFGSGLGKVEGIAIDSSLLIGDIDLSGNTKTGQKIVLRGDALGNSTTTIKFGSTSLTSGGLFVYDDSNATNSTTPKTLVVSGITDSNKLTVGSEINIEKSNFKGDIYADGNVSVNLEFTSGRTWTMDNSKFILSSGNNLIVHGEIANITASSPTKPTIDLTGRTDAVVGDIQLVNTGATLLLDRRDSNSILQKSFYTRGTSVKIDGGARFSGSSSDGKITAVFAKGTNLETIVTNQDKSTTYAITDKEVDTGYIGDKQLAYDGSYSSADGYNGNYIAESSTNFVDFHVRSTVNFTFVGESAWTSSSVGSYNRYGANSVFTFVNASEGSNNFNLARIKNLLSKDGSYNRTESVVFEGTNLNNGADLNSISNVTASNISFKMTFIKDSSNADTYAQQGKYFDENGEDLALSKANGALKDSILKVAQSSLNGAINFGDTNFNALFVGDQSFSSNASIQGGSATSTLTFRDANLNAGNGTSTISGIKGTIAFDLSHASEDASISGTLKNMFAGNGHYQTKFQSNQVGGLAINKLVFVNLSEANSSNTLQKLQTSGNYFNDTDTFGNLANSDYSQIGQIKNIDSSKNSNLTLANGATIALAGANQEIVFIGTSSHGFDNDSGNATKLGDSSGSSLTFIDAGTLKIANLLNIDSSGDQGGSGTINLIGNTKIEKTSVTGKNTLTFYKSDADNNSQGEVTGVGITINAVFNANNALADDNEQEIVSNPLRARASTIKGASTYDIGQTGEQTTYHLLFDYSSSGLTFGEHHAYTGNITGLTSDSVIKFKNAGYIDQSQIENTQATILVDNTQIRGDFTGDSAILDFRNNHPAISGKILTSDKTGANLSQKTLTFDLTGSTKKPIFSGIIQAGYKVAPNYSADADKLAQSVLTFQNAPALSLGNDNNTARGTNTNPSDFIKALANDAGFSGIGSAEITDAEFAKQKNISYILKGTKLVFQGTSISGNAINEANYELDLSFDARTSDRGQTSLGERIEVSKLTANSIAMGEYASNKPLGLTLDFKDSGSLVASNGLNVKLKEGARFNLSAESSNGNIGTIILSKNDGGTNLTKLDNVSKDSTLDISAGSMSFIGNFSQNDTFSGSGTSVGAINVAFNGDNKVFGIIAGRGEMNVSISGNAIVDNTSKTYDWAKTNGADVYLDASNATSGSITLAHTSGTVGAKGKAIASGTQTFTTLNMNDAQGNVILSGAFDLGRANLSFADSSKTLKIQDNTFLKISANSVLNFQGEQLSADKDVTLTLNSSTKSSQIRRDFTFVNIDPNVTVELKSLEANGTPHTNDWGVGGLWNFRGTNLKITSAFWSESNKGDLLQTYVFAKGSGTETNSQDSTKLSMLTTSDKINESALTGELKTLSSGDNVKNLILKNAKMTFIGKESFGIDAGNQKIDGTNGKITFGFYNGLIQSGDLIFDNTNNGGHSDLGKTATVQDEINLVGTDTFNLSVGKMQDTTGANNSTINAVYVNGTTTAGSDTSVTGVRYIDASGNHAYASAYATSNAGGALSQTQLKTLESKAYGNITMDNTVTATMKFIGENSHSFDGKTKVDSSGNVYYSADGSTGWKQYEIGTTGTGGKVKGAVYLGTTTTTSGTLATLTGGNSGSRFDFDHTTVKLDLIKDAGGDTYIYNSSIAGAINVGTPTNTEAKSTTIIFNDAVAPSGTSKAYIDNRFKDELGINIDFSTAHQMVEGNLTADGSGVNTLVNTSKTTNLVFIGKGSVNTGNDSSKQLNNGGKSIDLSFLKNIVQGTSPDPDTMGQSGYSFTFIDGGSIKSEDLALKVLDADKGDGYLDTTSGANLTIFGTAKVELINTSIVGERNIAQVGFIDAKLSDNRESSWGGVKGVDQFLIFDLYEGQYNQSLNNGNSNVIDNRSDNSHYIFTNFGTNSITLSNGLKDTINKALEDNVKTRLGSANPVISSNVNGYLGLRGVSVKGSIDETTNGVDIVFNSTDDISYIDGFDAGKNHTSKIVKGEGNYIAVAEGDANKGKISGKAILKAGDGAQGGIVEIKGASNKHITFIGEGAVEGGFDKLRISEGGNDSIYRFYEVGSLSQTFLTGVGLYNGSQTSATAGTFVFENTTISGNINANQNSVRTTALDPNNKTDKDNMLVFNNVDYSGEISGSLRRVLSFGANTDNVSISGGSDDSSYDFSNLAGKSINLSIDMSNSSPNTYYASKVTGFENGDISLVGSIKLAKTKAEAPNGKDYSNSFAFNNDASWTVTDSSRVMNLSLSNSGTNYNIDLASAPRTKSANNDLRVLEVGNLTSNGGQVLLGTMIDESNPANSKSDRIDASVINGTLYVTAKDVSLDKGNFVDQNIVLVTAEASNGVVKGAERKQGLSYVSTVLEHQTSSDNGANWNKVEDESSVNQNDSHRWILSSLKADTNQELVDESGFIVSNPYRMLMIETNNLNKRMGDLRDDNYNQGAWIRVFNGMDSGEGAKNLYTNIQLGYDYGTPAIGAKNYTGVAFSTSIVDIDGNQYSGKANTYSLGVYNAYIADSGLYVDTIAKYLYTDQKITPAGSSDSSFGSHALSLGLEVGYRAYMGETNFYIEPQAEAIGGIIFGVKDINMGVIGGMNVTGELKTTTTVNTRVGLVQGYSLKTQSGFRADFRLGVSLVNEFVSESDPVRLYDGITEAGTSIGNDTKAVVNVGTNLILTDQWRVYIDAERSFGGARNVDYQANIGARFSFGDKLTSLPKPEKPLPLKLKSEEKKEQDKATVSNTQEAKN